MKEMITVHWTDATDSVRQYVHAYSITNGYNPIDMVFWNLFMYTEPLSDDSWEYFWNMLYTTHFPDGTITLSKDFLNWTYNGNKWVSN